MRISGGDFGGRKLEAPKNDRVRPATDKVRQAVFNMLLSYGLPQSAKVMDLFCGTGSWGLEALSREAYSCLFVDNSPESIRYARQNAESFECDDICDFIRSDFKKLRIPQAMRENDSIGGAFDLVFMDPPYKQDFVKPALNMLIKENVMNEGGIVIVEAEKDLELSCPAEFIVKDQRIYGETQIFILERVFS